MEDNRIMKQLLTIALVGTMALTLTALTVSSTAKFPVTVNNKTTRLEFTYSPARKCLRMFVQKADAKGNWKRFGVASFNGTFKRSHEKLRKTLNSFYPFQKCEVKDFTVKQTASGQLTAFRIVRGDLWMDIAVVLDNKHSFITLSSSMQSEGIIPEFSFRMVSKAIKMTTDNNTPGKFKVFSARDYRNRNLHIKFREYAMCYTSSSPDLLLLLTPLKGSKRVLLPRGSFANTYFNLPVTMLTDRSDFPRDATTIEHYIVSQLELFKKYISAQKK